MSASAREEILISRLDEVFLPAENLSPYGLKDKWRVVPYDTHEQSGNMLSSIGTDPKPVTFDPKLSGWYRIYLQFVGESVLDVKLTSDCGFSAVLGNHHDLPRDGALIEESLWRSADMTGEAITISLRFE